MSNNDDKIKALLKKVAEKKEALGSKPKAQWNTNAVFKFNSHEFINLNTVKDSTDLVRALSCLLQHQRCDATAAERLGVSIPTFEWDGYTVEQWEQDFKTRLSIIDYDGKKKELDALQKKLDSLVSEEARTEMELDNIEALLG